MKKFISGFLIGALVLGTVSVSSAKVFSDEEVSRAKGDLTYTGSHTEIDYTEIELMKLELLEKIYSKTKSIDEYLRLIEIHSK